MRKVFVKSELASSLLAIVTILASTTLFNSNANALTRPPAEDRDENYKEWRNNKSERVNLSRDNENQQQRQEYRQPQTREDTPRQEAPRQEFQKPNQQDLSRINQMQFGRPNPYPNQNNNYQRPPNNPEPPKYVDRDNGHDRNDNRRDDNRHDDYRRDDNRHNDNRDDRRNNNWNNNWNWGSNNNRNDYRHDNDRDKNYSWNRYDHDSRKHFEFGRREGQNYWGPNGNNWSRWNNSWGDPNYYARRWGFDAYDQYRGWRRGNVWYSHPSLWNDWGGWYSFFLSDGIWGFSYSNYGDPYYNSYGNQCLRMQTSDWQYGRRAIYSFVACLNRWGQYEEVRGTRNFEGWDY